jgi:hypothetical protein
MDKFTSSAAGSAKNFDKFQKRSFLAHYIKNEIDIADFQDRLIDCELPLPSLPFYRRYSVYQF